MQSPKGQVARQPSSFSQQPSSPLRPASAHHHRSSPCTPPLSPAASSKQGTPTGGLVLSPAASASFNGGTKRVSVSSPLLEALSSLSVASPHRRLARAASPRASPSKQQSPAGPQSRLRGQTLITRAAAFEGSSDVPSDSSRPSDGGGAGAVYAAQAEAAAGADMMPGSELASQADAVQELRQSWASFKEMLGEMVTRVTSLQRAVSQLDDDQQEHSATTGVATAPSAYGHDDDDDDDDEGAMSRADLRLLEYEQAMAARDVQQIGHYLKTGDTASVQGSLVILMDYLNGQRLTASNVLKGGLLPLITSHIQPSLDETTGVALEAMNALLKADMVLDGPTDAALTPVAAPVMHVLEQCVNQLTWKQAGPSRAAAAAARFNQLYHSALHSASMDGEDDADLPVHARMSSPALTEAASQGLQAKESNGWNRRFSRSRAPSPPPPVLSTLANSHTGSSLEEVRGRSDTESPAPFQSYTDDDYDLEGPDTDNTPVRAPHNEHATIIAFYAVSVTMRLARFPSTARELVKRGGVRFLAKGLNVADPCLQQVCLLALCKLVKVGSHADNLVHVLQSGAVSVLYSLMSGRKTQSTTQAHLYYNRLNLASTDLHKAPGTSKPEDCMPPSAPVRDMSASLLLDMALLPEAPAHTADNGLVAPLVMMLSQSTESVTRMYGLLVLARLASRSRVVQLDAVREGAVPFLTQMMNSGTDDEALHAARLLAILAQATPTHEAISKPEVMCALTTLMASPCPQVVEHATSVFAIMANNPDTHFQVVGWGIIPLLVPLLATDPPAGSPPPPQQPTATTATASLGQQLAPGSKTQTYVLATLLLLAMHETRHADVICRAGALPHLIRLLRQGANSNVREYAAAVVSSLCHTVDIQMEVIAAGGVPALVQVLSTDEPQAQGHAAEALVQMAVVEDHRKRLIIRAGEILDALMDMLSCSQPASQYWGATLMQLLCQDETVLAEVSQMPGLVKALYGVLENQGPSASPELRRAQVQACWLIHRLAADPHVAKALVATDILRPLVYMLSLGWESVQRGAGGALHVMLGTGPDALGGASAVGLAKQEPGVMGSYGSGSAGEATGSAPRAQLLRIEPLDSNGHAAAAAALLSLAQNREDIRSAVQRELILQEAGFGRRVTLAGLYAST